MSILSKVWRVLITVSALRGDDRGTFRRITTVLFYLSAYIFRPYRFSLKNTFSLSSAFNRTHARNGEHEMSVFKRERIGRVRISGVARRDDRVVINHLNAIEIANDCNHGMFLTFWSEDDGRYSLGASSVLYSVSLTFPSRVWRYRYYRGLERYVSLLTTDEKPR